MTYATQEQQTGSTEYNGWSNHETWLMNLWLTNEESYYHEMMRILSTYTSLNDQAEALLEFMQNEHEELEVTGVWSDIISNTLWRANWHEIAEANTEEVR
jgi:nucleotide-binding universal stress UspA family protein